MMTPTICTYMHYRTLLPPSRDMAWRGNLSDPNHAMMTLFQPHHADLLSGHGRQLRRAYW